MESWQTVSNSGNSSDEEDWGQLLDNSCYNIPKGQTPALKIVKTDTFSGQGKEFLLQLTGADQHGQTVIHIDIDCFYAQVEMIRNPELRGKPLGIQQKNIIVTSNYEARARGVGKLMYLKDAKKACPELCIVNGEDLTHYRDMSYKITASLAKYSGTVERLGFDENFVDVSEMVRIPPWTEVSSTPEGFVYQKCEIREAASMTNMQCNCGCHRRLTIASHIAAEMRKTLFTELGITCCAGIAHNKLLAKLVGGTHKPNQQTVLYPSHVGEIMSSIQELRKIPGLGHKTCKRLEALGVNSVPALQCVSLEILQAEFGTQTAKIMQNLSCGIDDSKVVKTGQPQSISDEDSFRKCDNIFDAKAKVSELLDNVIRRLDVDGRIPQTLRVSVRKLVPGVKYPNRQSKQGPIPPAYFKGADKKSKLLDLSMQFFEKLIDTDLPFHLTLINICVTNFTSQSGIKKGLIDSFFTSPKKSVTASVSKQKQEACVLTDVVEPGSVSGGKEEPAHCRGRSHPNLLTQECSDVIPGILVSKLEGPKNIFLKTSGEAVCLTENINRKNLVNDDNILQCSEPVNSLNVRVGSYFSHKCNSSTSIQSGSDSELDRDVCDSLNEVKASPSTTRGCCDTNNDSIDSKEKQYVRIPSHSSVNCRESSLSYLKSHLGRETEFEVFIELPADIQREIILAQKSKTSDAVVKKMLTIVESLDCKNTEAAKCLSEHVKQGTCSPVLAVDQQRECAELDTSEVKVTDHLSDFSENNNQDCKVVANLPGLNLDSGVQSISHVPDCETSGESKGFSEGRSGVDSIEIPPGYDVNVFRELPTHIQKSLMSEYRTTSEFKTMKKRKLDASSPENCKTVPKKRLSSGNIAKFFKKR